MVAMDTKLGRIYCNETYSIIKELIGVYKSISQNVNYFLV